MPKTDASKNNTKKRRWYEAEPTVNQSIELLENFPDEILTIIAEGVNQIAENEFRTAELMKSYKSLGEDKVLALYKSKKKQRSYDNNTHMHKVVNYLSLLSESQRLVLARQIIDIVSLVRDYLANCQKALVAPTMTHVREIRDSYVKEGMKGARERLLQIREIFLGGKRAPGKPDEALDIVGKKKQEEVAPEPEEEAKDIGGILTNLNESDDGLKLNLSQMNR